MRQLTASQKKLLAKWSESATCVEELTSEQWDRLERINDTEILYQNANRYLSDLAMKKIYG